MAWGWVLAEGYELCRTGLQLFETFSCAATRVNSESSQGNRAVGGIAVLAVPFVSEIIFPLEFGFETSTPM